MRNCLLVKFYGGRAALVGQIICTRLRSAKGLVGKVPIDVDIGDLSQPFGGVRGVVGILSVVPDIRLFMQEEYAALILFCSEPVEYCGCEKVEFLVG